MFKRINWLVMWLVGTVTLGIYKIVAWYQMTKHQNRMAQMLGDKKVMGYIGVVLLSIVTCGIFLHIWNFLFIRQQQSLAQAKGIDLFPTENTFLLWLLLYVPVLKFYVLCSNYNKLCDVYEEC